MIEELLAGTNVSIRMSSRMSQIVSIGDIMVVVLTAAVGVYGAPNRMKRLLKIMEVVSSVDTCLGVEYSLSRERNYSIGVSVFLLLWTSLLVGDFSLYINEAKKTNRHYAIISNYIGFYLLYYIVVLLEVQFTYTAWVVKQRLAKINDALDHTVDAIKTDTKVTSKDYHKSSLNTLAVTVIAAPTKIVPEFHLPINKIGSMVDSLSQFPHPALLLTKKGKFDKKLLVSTSEAVRKLSDLHGSISTAVHHANVAYGYPLLIILGSTMLHLIVTPYFLISELSSSHIRVHYTLLQFCWCITHSMRLLLVVEPCHLTIAEGKRTEALACRMLGDVCEVDRAGGVHQAVDRFARQVTMRSLDFTALGVCVLDRPLVAAVSGAVTTYLVILIQFQKDDRK